MKFAWRNLPPPCTSSEFCVDDDEYVENMLKSSSSPKVEFKANVKYLFKKTCIMLLKFPVVDYTEKIQCNIMQYLCDVLGDRNHPKRVGWFWSFLTSVWCQINPATNTSNLSAVCYLLMVPYNKYRKTSNLVSSTTSGTNYKHKYKIAQHPLATIMLYVYFKHQHKTNFNVFIMSGPPWKQSFLSTSKLILPF